MVERIGGWRGGEKERKESFYGGRGEGELSRERLMARDGERERERQETGM